MSLFTLGNVIAWAPSFAPTNWMLCQGQLLPINNYTALYSLIGTYYGGDGRTTFALPDLRGRAIVGEGAGPGISMKPLGQRGGAENVYIDISHMPAHNHPAPGQLEASFYVSADQADESTPLTGSALAAFYHEELTSEVYGYTTGQATVPLNTGTVAGEIVIGNNGGSASHVNEMPFTVLNYIICVNGIYPSRA